MQTETGKDIAKAAAWLQKGELVAIPTETVYGLAANALNPDAVLKIFETKGRPSFNPLIVHVHSAKEFEKYALDVPELVYQLAEKFSPGPLTFVLPKKDIVPDIVTGGGETVALRVPGHPLTLKLLGSLDFPLAAPSANPSGYISPVTALHVMDQLNGLVPYILDGGPSMIGVESTVVMPEGKKLVVLRPGGIPVEDLKEIAGEVELRISISEDPKSPGQLKSHYAPRIPLKLGKLETLIIHNAGKKIAVLAFREAPEDENIFTTAVLSSTGDLHEAARNLFSELRRLDNSGAEIILAEKVPDYGLGAAINDRLTRAGASE
ncbi:MAG TPA: L-threonylcarbamoyladenylate synthase [Bacteroidia bacterium]|nr:L-threonylcarbamoyladenylate synthase [Bacteroidia bacterium]